MKKFALKLTAAIVLDGEIKRAGSIVTVDHATATNLLHRGKAEVATEADEQEDEAGAEQAEVATEAEPEAKKTSRKGR